MDPQACLDAAEAEVKAAEEKADNAEHIEAAQDYLENYRTWRRRGGFEPHEGDRRMCDLNNRIACLPVESEVC